MNGKNTKTKKDGKKAKDTAEWQIDKGMSKHATQLRKRKQEEKHQNTQMRYVYRTECVTSAVEIPIQLRHSFSSERTPGAIWM